MKQFFSLAVIVSFCSILAGCTGDQSETSADIAPGPYFGQTPPGLRPVLFAPGSISTPDHNERDLAITTDGSEVYFTRDATIMVLKRSGERWSEPEPVSFSYDCPEFEPFLTRDARRMYFISKRPLAGAGEPEEYQLWMVDRDESGWGRPERLNDLVDFYPSLAHDSIMYFTSRDTDLYRTCLVDGRMTGREKLSDSVNTPEAEYNAYIAPDESFLLFTSHGWSDQPNGGDLYVSYRRPDGSWTRARSLGSGINTGALDYCPSLSPDGKYLFFSSRSGGTEDIYWVDASIIDSLRTLDLDFVPQLVAIALESDSAHFRRRLDEMRSRYGAYSDFGRGLLSTVGDRLLATGHADQAGALMAFVYESYPDERTPVQSLKLALVKPDDNLWRQTVASLTVTDDRLPGLERAVNLLGYYFLQLDRDHDALKVFRLNVDLFPVSGNVHDSYGEALLASGDTTAAVTSYRQALELDSTNANARQILDGLGAI